MCGTLCALPPPSARWTPPWRSLAQRWSSTWSRCNKTTVILSNFLILDMLWLSSPPSGRSSRFAKQRPADWMVKCPVTPQGTKGLFTYKHQLSIKCLQWLLLHFELAMKYFFFFFKSKVDLLLVKRKYVFSGENIPFFTNLTNPQRLQVWKGKCFVNEGKRVGNCPLDVFSN